MECTLDWSTCLRCFSSSIKVMNGTAFRGCLQNTLRCKYQQLHPTSSLTSLSLSLLSYELILDLRCVKIALSNRNRHSMLCLGFLIRLIPPGDVNHPRTDRVIFVHVRLLYGPPYPRPAFSGLVFSRLCRQGGGELRRRRKTDNRRRAAVWAWRR